MLEKERRGETKCIAGSSEGFLLCSGPSAPLARHLLLLEIAVVLFVAAIRSLIHFVAGHPLHS